jgi:hypothetical protein
MLFGDLSIPQTIFFKVCSILHLPVKLTGDMVGGEYFVSLWLRGGNDVLEKWVRHFTTILSNDK